MPTHLAVADESYTTASRFRSVAMVTFEDRNRIRINQRFGQLIKDSNLKEFKWKKLKQAREKFAAEKIIALTLELALEGKLRVDTLIWDTQDERHEVQGRDDIANLQIMYFQLFRNVMRYRWPADSTWHLYPDENSALDWKEVKSFLDKTGFSVAEPSLVTENFQTRLQRDFKVSRIHQVKSHQIPLCQVADLFAGLGAYSYAEAEKYRYWLTIKTGQQKMPGADNPPKLSNRDKTRCEVIHLLHQSCEKQRWRVGFASGLKTCNPNEPINFWLYQPQHPLDKAPVRNSQ
jgi:hypothetical protein